MRHQEKKKPRKERVAEEARSSLPPPGRASSPLATGLHALASIVAADRASPLSALASSASSSLASAWSPGAAPSSLAVSSAARAPVPAVDPVDYFFTLAFSSKGWDLPKWRLEEADEYKALAVSLHEVAVTATSSKSERRSLFAWYKKSAGNHDSLRHLLYLSWLTHISEIENKREQMEWKEDFKQHIMEHESVSESTLHYVGRRMKLAWFILHFRINQMELGLSLQSLSTASMGVILDDFLLARFFRVLQRGPRKYRREDLPALSKSIEDGDGKHAGDWRYREGGLQFKVFHSDNWLEEESIEEQPSWWTAKKLDEHRHWKERCMTREREIRALAVTSIGAEVQEMDGEDRREVVFSNEERVWMSEDDIQAADVEQWSEKWAAEMAEDEDEEAGDGNQEDGGQRVRHKQRKAVSAKKSIARPTLACGKGERVDSCDAAPPPSIPAQPCIESIEQLRSAGTWLAEVDGRTPDIIPTEEQVNASREGSALHTGLRAALQAMRARRELRLTGKTVLEVVDRKDDRHKALLSGFRSPNWYPTDLLLGLKDGRALVEAYDRSYPPPKPRSTRQIEEENEVQSHFDMVSGELLTDPYSMVDASGHKETLNLETWRDQHRRYRVLSGSPKLNRPMTTMKGGKEVPLYKEDREARERTERWRLTRQGKNYERDKLAFMASFPALMKSFSRAQSQARTIPSTRSRTKSSMDAESTRSTRQATEEQGGDNSTYADTQAEDSAPSQCRRRRQPRKTLAKTVELEATDAFVRWEPNDEQPQHHHNSPEMTARRGDVSSASPVPESRTSLRHHVNNGSDAVNEGGKLDDPSQLLDQQLGRPVPCSAPGATHRTARARLASCQRAAVRVLGGRVKGATTSKQKAGAKGSSSSELRQLGPGATGAPEPLLEPQTMDTSEVEAQQKRPSARSAESEASRVQLDEVEGQLWKATSSSSWTTPTRYGPQPHSVDSAVDHIKALLHLSLGQMAEPNRYLTDHPIAFIMEAMNYHNRRLRYEDVLCFDPQVVTKTLTSAERGIKHQLRTDVNAAADAARYWLLPRNIVHHHWWLDVYDRFHHVLYRADSSGSQPDPDPLLPHLSDEPSVIKIQHLEVAMQNDGYSCGDHVIQYALVIARPGWFPNNGELARVVPWSRSVLAELLAGRTWESERPEPSFESEQTTRDSETSDAPWEVVEKPRDRAFEESPRSGAVSGVKRPRDNLDSPASDGDCALRTESGGEPVLYGDTPSSPCPSDPSDVSSVSTATLSSPALSGWSPPPSPAKRARPTEAVAER